MEKEMKRVCNLRLLDCIGPILGCNEARIYSMEVVDGDHRLGLIPLDAMPGDMGGMIWLILNPNIEVEVTAYTL